jgi:beta-galactosidase
LRTVVPFNHDWLFKAEKVAEDTPDIAFESITLPHSNKIFPHHNFDDSEYQFISTYRKHFTLPEPRSGRRIYIDFEGAMTAATVSINGYTFEEHKGGYVPFSYDITDYLNEDGENLLTVYLDSTERKDIPPHGHTVDYMVFGGIYRDVSLRYVSDVFIENVFVRTGDVLSDKPKLEIDVTLQNQRDREYTGIICIALHDSSGNYVNLWCLESQDNIPKIDANSTKTFTVVADGINTVKTWKLNEPNLYSIEVTLSNFDTELDKLYQNFGFREAQFREDGFYLNGEPLKLIGLNRHQNYPYIGAAAPARLQRKDADIIKYELGCNIVRTSHYPQDKAFLDRCDEIGLLVFEEIPGWQHIGDEAWKDLAIRDVRAMIERDRNHPSIIIWGVRINESWDDHELYTRTNTLARELDPTRQTGGVRFFQGSEFLEDVFTFNDFSNGVLEPEHTPHLITEFNGHMFPTKSFDNEERRVEHALRHAKIQSAARTMGGVSGAIGWCAFDYNTHKEFGAGDRICYHGVSDIFRLPKFAAYFYESQQSPQQKVVLRAATHWHLGDIKEGLIEPVIVFSNCDEIVAYVGGVKEGTFKPDFMGYPNLPHPPFKLTSLGAMLAQPWGDLRLVGYINGEAVAEQSIAADGLPPALVLEADDSEINADGIDMTRIVFKIVDKYGNPLPYSTSVVTFEVEGDAELIGENPFPLVGGQAAMYLKAGRTAGEVVVRAKTARLNEAEIKVKTIDEEVGRE